MWGGDPWCTYDEIDAFDRAAEKIAESRKKAADDAKKHQARRPARRRR